MSHSSKKVQPQIQGLTDQHAGATIPTAAQQIAIQNVLNPTTGAGPTTLPWDGAAQPDGSLTADGMAARFKLQTELTKALNDHLDAAIPEAKGVAARRKLPMTSFALALGAPETTIPSRLQRFHTQWIYAQRGLTAHVNNHTGEIVRLYAYPVTTTRKFLNSWLSRVEMRRLNRRQRF